MRINPEITGVDVVVLGDFNPTIFSPRWLSSHGFIRDSVADGAQVQVIHQEITDFTADWLHLQAMRDRFTLKTSQAPFVRLRDLVLRVFSEYLPHTPLRAFGINFSVHFLVDSRASRDRIGNLLAPLEPWGPWREKLDLDGKGGGLTRLQISQLAPRGRRSGDRINVQVEPSNRVGREGTGVFVSVNDHFVAGSGAPPMGADGLMKVLGEEFSPSLKRSEGIVDHIMSLAEVTIE